LAATLPEDDRNRVPEQQVMPAGELLNHIRELVRQLAETMAQAGYLREQLDTQQLQLTDAKAAQPQLADKEREAADLQYKLDEMTGRNRRQRTLLTALVAAIERSPLTAFLVGIGLAFTCVALGWYLRGLWGPVYENRGWAALLVFAVIGAAVAVRRQEAR